MTNKIMVGVVLAAAVMMMSANSANACEPDIQYTRVSRVIVYDDVPTWNNYSYRYRSTRIYRSPSYGWVTYERSYEPETVYYRSSYRSYFYDLD
jgi:hypothetical protein